MYEGKIMSPAKKNANLSQLVADFQRDNSALLDAMKFFEVSNAEYERALQALTAAPSITATSTHSTQQGQRDAVVVE
jgi:hypothetical protein